jgi:hypothetical protein
MYRQQLQDLELRVTGASRTGFDLDAAIELDALKELINAQQVAIDTLTAETINRLEQLKPANKANDGIMAFTEVIANNHLRDKIRKAEHSVFYLKHHVNKLLSMAS